MLYWANNLSKKQQCENEIENQHHSPMKTNEIINSDVIDALKDLPDNSVDCCVTSPPYFGLRDYGVEGQIGLFI